MSKFNKYSDVMLALGLVAILVVMIIPMPPVFMDIMLTLDIALGLLIMVTVLCFYLIGDGMRDALDPHSTRKPRK